MPRWTLDENASLEVREDPSVSEIHACGLCPVLPHTCAQVLWHDSLALRALPPQGHQGGGSLVSGHTFLSPASDAWARV